MVKPVERQQKTECGIDWNTIRQIVIVRSPSGLYVYYIPWGADGRYPLCEWKKLVTVCPQVVGVEKVLEKDSLLVNTISRIIQSNVIQR